MSTEPLPTDHGGMEVLTMSESFELLASVPVGRFAFVAGGEPVVLPVNFAVDDRTVVFRSTYGAKLDAAWREVPAAFEADDFDEEERTGWSVVLRGHAEWVDGEDEAERLEGLGLESWAHHRDRSTRWIRFRPSDVSGRRIVRLAV